MADSDDEYDRKRRDKFRGERSSGDAYRSDRRDDRRGGGAGGGSAGREDWAERNPFRGSGGGAAAGGGGGGRPPRSDYRDYRGGGGAGARDRYGSPTRDMHPAKRMRPDWGDDLRGGGGRYGRLAAYDPYLMQAWNEHYAAQLHSSYGAAAGLGGGGAHAAHMAHAREPAGNVASMDQLTQPAMLTLKQFLDTQDDGISDAEVLRKYTEYKVDFKRQQLNEFFVAHKDEEWFKNKYHPIESVKRREEQMGYLNKRVEVFTELLDNGQIKSVTLDTNQTDPLLRLLDTAVIKLEGGTDDDLKILDEKPKEVSSFPERSTFKPYENKSNFSTNGGRNRDDDVILTAVETKREDGPKPAVVTPPRLQLAGGSDDENWDDDEDDDATEAKTTAAITTKDNDKPQAVKKEAAGSDEENWDADEDDASVAAAAVEDTKKVEEVKKKDRKALKRKRTRSDSSTSSSTDSDSSSSSSSDDEEQDEKIRQRYDIAPVKEHLEDKQQVIEAKKIESPPPEQEDKDEQLNSNGADSRDAATPTIDEKPMDVDELEKQNDEAREERAKSGTPNLMDEKEFKAEVVVADVVATKENEVTTTAAAEEDGTATPLKDEPPTVTIDLDKEASPAKDDGPKPRALHRTSSIFLRSIAPAITKAEIVNLCKRFDGFLRVAVADPAADRRWYRRGWVTFQRDVNIKEICWNMNNARLRDCEMGAIVNRDLSRRVRPVNGLTAHKTVVRADIKLCAKIAMNLDDKFKLWEKLHADEKAIESAQKSNGSADVGTFGFNSKNPVLQNITDFLIEEASAEEEELLGISGENKDENADGIERDAQLISVLDCLILYLRIVHSVDFYNHCEYPYEDEMPNRCGIIHTRGPAPSKVTQNELLDYIKSFETKMQQFLAKVTFVDDEELKNLGCKDAEVEVEKFVQANTQELAKDKWLCPLSGKKFKGPEFIRKHIFNKHCEKVDEVRTEVEFFNNYLRDPKRPQLPEHPGSGKRTTSESSTGAPVGAGGGGGGYRTPYFPPAYAAPFAYAPPMMMMGGGRGRGGGPRRPRNDYRQIIQYRDLDAPTDPVDYFN